MRKIVDQLDIDWNAKKNASGSTAAEQAEISDERASLIYIIDSFNKHLFEIDSQPIRRVRETLDDLTKQLLVTEPQLSEKLLFRVRQFFSSYRIEEYTYIKKTFDDFRGIIWDLVDQLSEDFADEEAEDNHIQNSLNYLREAVEANSIDELKKHSRTFIDTYIEYQTKRENRREFRMNTIRKNLAVVKKQLVDANTSMNQDHLTKAYNRKSFDEQLKKLHKLSNINKTPVTLITLDIDHFKKINDRFGHPIGDFCLVECVRMLREIFYRELDFVARVGGEEFAIILPDCTAGDAIDRAESALNKFRSEVFVKDDMRIQFTASMGIAQLQDKEDIELWMKRADQALYESKNTGRNKWTVAPKTLLKVA